MSRILLVPVLFTALLCACGGGASPPTDTSPTANGTASLLVTPGDRPLGIPTTAATIAQTKTLGTITRQANQPPQGNGTRTLLDAGCESGQIVITTSKETIYAARDCNGFWDAPAKQLFVGKEVAIVLEVTPQRLRILIDSLEGAHSEFTVTGIWLD